MSGQGLSGQGVSGHQDRLAGLLVLSAVLSGAPTVAVRGFVPRTVAPGVGTVVELDDDVAAVGAGVGAAVLAVPAAGVAVAELEALGRAPGGGRPRLVWVLWGGRGSAVVHRAAARAGFRVVAAYRYVGTAASPTHLVREGPGHALRWFAGSVRPRWGPRSRLARLGNVLPRIGHHFLDGRAVLFRSGPGEPLAWPGADVARSRRASGAPALLHLGGGATAGRVVLTWADRSGAPTHHTKLAPGHRAAGVVAEAQALTTLAAIPAVAGTVPTLLGLRHEPTWVALTASHLPGRPPRVRAGASGCAGFARLPDVAGSPGLPGLDRLVRRVTTEPEVDRLVTRWLAELARASQGLPASVSGVGPLGGAGAGRERLAAAVASLEDPALQSVVRRGLDLGATSTGLLHGDLWSGNVHRVRGADGGVRIAVLDWESALVGHPLVDLLTWLVARGGSGAQVRHRALEVLAGGSPVHEGSSAGHHVRTLLAALGQEAGPPEIEALVLAQMVVVAVHGGPVGGDGVHERAWLAAVHDVWASWQGAGGSPWSAPREVAR